MSKYTFLFDGGHGGVINGVYQTALKTWKRSYFKDGKLMNTSKSVEYLEQNCDLKHYEGECNRDIIKRIKILCDKNKISYVDVVDSELDVALETRVAKANAEYAKNKNCIYLSIHSDAFTTQDAQGFSVYTSPGQTKSDIYASLIFKEMVIEFPEQKGRPDYTDSDPDKEENFYVLKHTNCPAVLSENLFYTNYKECQILESEEGRQKIAEAHFRAILKIEKL